MTSRSSLGRYSRTSLSSSRNLVAVRTLVAICWRKVAIIDYSWGVKRSPTGSGSTPSRKSAPNLRKSVNPLAHTQHMPGQAEAAAGFDQRNDSIEIRPRVGTGDHNPNGMKQIFALGSSLILYLLDDGLEAFCAESIGALVNPAGECRDYLTSDIGREQWLIVHCGYRLMSVIVEKELGFVRQLI